MKLHIEVAFTEEVLGMMPQDRQLLTEFIASKAPDAASLEEEVASIGTEEALKAQTTVFPRDPQGRPCFWDYQIKGWAKDCCGMLARSPGSVSSKIKAWRKRIDGLLFVAPRLIPIALPDGATFGRCERALRAMTPQGERTALAASESVPAGSTMAFDITLLDPGLVPAVKEWLDYGMLRGFGQWRNSGKGRYTYTLDQN